MSDVLLVTGASRGIGAAIARLAARDGWDVGVNYGATVEEVAEAAGWLLLKRASFFTGEDLLVTGGR